MIEKSRHHEVLGAERISRSESHEQLNDQSVHFCAGNSLAPQLARFRSGRLCIAQYRAFRRTPSTAHNFATLRCLANGVAFGTVSAWPAS